MGNQKTKNVKFTPATISSTKIADQVFERLKKSMGEPVMELLYTNHYTLLVAVIMSARATDKKVNEITEHLFKKIDTPRKMLVFGVQNLEKTIKAIGFFRTKARNIIQMSKMLVEEFNGQIPDSLENLVKLSGVGRKSANIILNTVFAKPTIAVDTHVFRVTNRLGLCNTKNPTQTEFALKKIVPKKWQNTAHKFLVLHGRYICKALRPMCTNCVLQNLCKHYKAQKNKSFKNSK